MLGELRLAALLGIINAGITEKDWVKAADIFYQATVGEAKALGRKDGGRIAEGYRTDMLIINTMPALLYPLAFPLINVIH